MAFSIWLNDIINKLQLKNKDIARLSDIHPSTVSRYSTGVQAPNDKSLRKLTVGLCKAASEKNRLFQLPRIISHPLIYEKNLFFTPPFTEIIVHAGEHIHADLLNAVYFSALKNLKRQYGDSLVELSPYITNFDQKLDYLMTLFSISNSRLANSLKVDSSLVSKWRSGIRTPKSDHPAVKDIACFFAKVIERSQKKSLGKAQKYFVSYLLSTFSKSKIEDALHQWLLSHQSEEKIVQQSVNAILDQISMSQAQSSEHIHEEPSYFLDFEINRQQNIYHNLKGLREAVVRFLSDIVLSSSHHKLLLFSNQDLSWLMADRNFLKTWEILMKTILHQGHRIEIIHHLGRSPREITLGIEKWLPLHLNGNILPFTCDNLNDAENNPLIKTMFIDVGHAAISAELISGMENHSTYHYYVSSQKVQSLENQFEQLKQSSQPILSVHRDDAEFFEEFLRELRHIKADKKRKQEKLMILSDAIPLYFFDNDTLRQILLEKGISDEKADTIFQQCVEMVDIIRNHLQSGEIYLIGNFTHSFKEGDVCKLPGMLTNENIEVSKSQYKNNLESLRRIAEDYDRFHLVDLELSPFDNLHIFSLGNRAVYILKAGAPQVLVKFQHQYSIDSFNRYLLMLISKGLTLC